MLQSDVAPELVHLCEEYVRCSRQKTRWQQSHSNGKKSMILHVSTLQCSPNSMTQ